MFNTTNRYGLVAIVLHWIMAVMIFGLFALGWYMVDLTYYDKLYKTLPFVHKSVGVLFALLLIFRLLWRMINITPNFEQSLASWEKMAARIAHMALYILMILIAASGYLISTANGASIAVFDLFQLPAIITGLPDQEDISGLVHKYLAYALMGLALLHAGAALKHHYIDKDNTLRKMFGVTSPSSIAPGEQR